MAGISVLDAHNFSIDRTISNHSCYIHGVVVAISIALYVYTSSDCGTCPSYKWISMVIGLDNGDGIKSGDEFSVWI